MLIVNPSPRGIVGTVLGKPGLYRVIGRETSPILGEVCLYVEPVEEPGSCWPVHRDNFSPLSKD